VKRATLEEYDAPNAGTILQAIPFDVYDKGEMAFH
jgi:hypothetical protein